MLVKTGCCVKLSAGRLVFVGFYAENDVPHPQVLDAFGLLKINPLLSKPLLKSISQSYKYIS